MKVSFMIHSVRKICGKSIQVDVSCFLVKIVFVKFTFAIKRVTCIKINQHKTFQSGFDGINQQSIRDIPTVLYIIFFFFSEPTRPLIYRKI